MWRALFLPGLALPLTAAPEPPGRASAWAQSQPPAPPPAAPAPAAPRSCAPAAPPTS